MVHDRHIQKQRKLGIDGDPRRALAICYMEKRDMIRRLAMLQENEAISMAAVNDIVESAFDTISLALRRDKKITFPGFGSFVVRHRRKRKSVHPATQQEIEIPSHKTVVFRKSKKWQL